MSSLPRPSHSISGSSQPDKLYYDWFLSVERRLTQSGVSKEYIDALIKQIATQLGSPDGSISGIPLGADDVLFFGGDGILISGSFSSGAVTVGLQQVPDAGGGSLQKTVFDAYGRKTGTSAATTSDLPEGLNLYYTDARVDARIAASAIYMPLTDGQIPANLIQNPDGSLIYTRVA